MKQLYLLIICIPMLSVSIAYAQTGSITGNITDENGLPLEAVTISLKGTSEGAYTNADGNFRIENVTPGKYTLNISAVGFSSKSTKIEIIENQLTNIPNLLLSSKTQKLSEVVVTANSQKYIEEKVSKSLRQVTPIRKLPQNIQIVSKELLKDQLVTSIMDGVIRNVSGVTMLEHWGHFARIHMRGFRIPAFRNGFNLSDSWGPLAEDMAFTEQIEFVKGPSASMITAGEPGGIYNVVTKRATEKTIREVSPFAINRQIFLLNRLLIIH
ncbi:MAG: carboxypeptidase-like regulatory domain-containing protein [Bacteroidota bacterium]